MLPGLIHPLVRANESDRQYVSTGVLARQLRLPNLRRRQFHSYSGRQSYKLLTELDPVVGRLDRGVEILTAAAPLI